MYLYKKMNETGWCKANKNNSFINIIKKIYNFLPINKPYN